MVVGKLATAIGAIILLIIGLIALYFALVFIGLLALVGGGLIILACLGFIKRIPMPKQISVICLIAGVIILIISQI